LWRYRRKMDFPLFRFGRSTVSHGWLILDWLRAVDKFKRVERYPHAPSPSAVGPRDWGDEQHAS
jgi:hypothetical protein